MTNITIAQQCYQQGRPEEAAAVCRRILSHHPGHPDASNLLGIIECQAGNFDDGLRHLETVAKASPVNVTAQCNLAQALMQAGRLEDAASAYRNALELDPANSNARGSLAMVLQRLQHTDEAERLCLRALESQPDDVLMLLSLGTVLAMQGRHQEAVQSLRRVLEIEPGHPTATANLATSLQEAGELDEALGLYRQVLAQNPRHLDALVNAGHLFNEKGDAETALQSYQTALSVDPRCPDAHYYAGAIFQRRGDYDRAVEHFNAVVKAEPAFERAHWGLQQSFLLMDEPGQALRACERCLDALPDNQMTVANQAFAHLLAGDEHKFDYLYNLEFFPYRVHIQAPDARGSIDALNEALVREILDHPSLRWQHDDYDTSSRAFAYGILEEPTDAINLFERGLRLSIDTFIDGLEADPDHPFLGRIPGEYGFRMWATVIQQGGWHRAHNHEKAWLSGVYYVQCPHTGDDGDASGWIEFDGFTHYGSNQLYSRKVRRVKPEPGLLLFFPSYMLHATRPFTGDDYRISIAFDVTPPR